MTAECPQCGSELTGPACAVCGHVPEPAPSPTIGSTLETPAEAALRGASSGGRSWIVVALAAIVLLAGGIAAGFAVSGRSTDEGTADTVASAPSSTSPSTGSTTITSITTTTTAPAERVSVFELEVGLCFNDEADDSNELETLPAVDCDTPHDNEVFFIYDADDGSYPGRDLLFDLARDRCVAEFEPYVGTDYYESNLDVFPIVPTGSGWSDGDREVICALYAADLSKLVESMERTRR
jgi:hypothetical protein